MTDSIDAILVCGAGYVSGKEIMALTLARGMKRRGKTIHVLCSSWNDGDFISRLDQESIGHSQLPFGFISATLRWEYIRMNCIQILRWPGLLLEYASLLRRFRPRRVIHTNWHHALLLWPLLRPDRDIFWFHELVPDLRQYRVMLSRLALRLESFVAVSHAVRACLVARGVPAQKVTVVHNGIEDPCAGEPSAGRPDEGLRVGIVGQIGPWKGHDDLIEALGLLKGGNKAITLKIFGRGEAAYRDKLTRRASQLGLEGRVEWMGFVKNPTQIYGDLDICIVPSRCEEALSMTAVEAGFCRRPVVASTRGGLPEVVEDGITGFLVPAGAPQELAHAIDRLAAEPELRQRMGGNAKLRMKRMFSEEQFVDGFVRLLQDQKAKAL